ncbi:hypothetical protein GHT06_007399 [Daphnia sinensis]|uniref:Uncharacterized protein n=1 Tax=Daphnia sinensis TaxID=1820382 RepID=A0AAD5PKE8_9CRUS|nr:hypothetical protein GHT06_007399 [Daphnia sinensis]
MKGQLSPDIQVDTGAVPSLKLKPLSILIEYALQSSPELKSNMVDIAGQTLTWKAQKKSWLDVLSLSGSTIYGGGSVLDAANTGTSTTYVVNDRKTAIAAASMTFYSTRNEKKEYESQAVLSTGLVSGYNIETSKGGRIDYGYTDNEMENILGMARSLETKQEAVARLLAQALMQKAPSPEILGQDAFNELKKAIPDDIRKQVVDYNSFSVTLAKVKEWRDSEGDNKIKALLEGGDAFFGVEHMETMTIKKEGKSDMIRITYSTNDPSVCRNTINTLVDVFIQKRSSFKEGQSSDVLAFFEKSTNDAASSLSSKEDNLLAFMEQNKIINYYEQTRFIASKKEELDEMYFKEMMTLAAADSARRHLELQLDNRFNLPKLIRV